MTNRRLDDVLGEKMRLVYESGGGARKWWPTAYVVREFTKFLKNHFAGRNDLVGVELGVFTGCNGESIYDYLKDQLKFLGEIDSWEGCGETDDAQLEHLVETYFLLKGKKKIVIIKGWSKEVSQIFGPIFDFAYVDSSHTMVEVTWDFEVWYPLVKPGGVFGGHDYVQVKAAVDKFFEGKNVDITLGSAADWWIIKGEQK